MSSPRRSGLCAPEPAIDATFALLGLAAVVTLDLDFVMNFRPDVFVDTVLAVIVPRHGGCRWDVWRVRHLFGPELFDYLGGRFVF